MKPLPHLPTGLLLATALAGYMMPARALCPEKLPVALLEECIVVEGLGQKYPVEEALAEWRRRHADKAGARTPAAPEAGIAATTRQEKAAP